MRYIPHTEADVARMLRVIGVGSVDELFSQIIPDKVRLRRPLALPPALDEASLLAHLGELAVENAAPRPARANGPLSFLGAGVYPHAIPTAVDMLLSRSEFYTSYTPYQPEISQGTLQAIFEYQTIVSELTGLAVANASMYDGSTACAEAILMARRVSGKPNVLLAGGLHPEYLAVARTYMSALDATLTTVPIGEDGRISLAALDTALAGGQVGCVVVQSPSFLGSVIDLAPLAERAHQAGALLVAVCPEPLALAVMQAPGAAGADIAVGEGVGLAIPPTLGAPAVGLFATRAEHVRAIPGRLVGETVDHDGRRGYVLTLATREQHIRREKATSNICTNQGLIALAFTIHMCLLGKRGFADLARLCYAKARYAEEVLGKAGFLPRFPGTPTFTELCVKVPGGDADRLIERAAARGIFAGVSAGKASPSLGDCLLVAVNEMHSRTDLDKLAAVLAEVVR